MVGVSIHAPARGATCPAGRRSPPTTCFNPRTREGCDRETWGAYPCLTRFNPRTREGCDVVPGGRTDVVVGVSIHAPARGATRSCRRCITIAACFNPRTREGCDAPKDGEKISGKSFNPRTREGCDTFGIGHSGARIGFNPRTREGCDSLILEIRI